MNNRDDDPEKKKGNTDKRYEPKGARHEDRLARGDIDMPGPGGNKFSAQSRSHGREDHQRAQKAPDRDFSKDNKLAEVVRGDRDNQKALSKQFKSGIEPAKDDPTLRTQHNKSRGREH